MSFELTPDQREAVLANAGLPLHIHDAESNRIYLLIEQGLEPQLDAEYVQSGLNAAQNQIDRGEVGTRSIDAVIAKANDFHRSKKFFART